jgi:hypothetical protein
MGGNGNTNGTAAHEGSVTIPPDTVVEVVYPAPFATPPTLTIYAWHSDWEIKEQTEKSFRIRNKNQAKSRSVEWKARGLRVITPPPSPQYKMIRTAPQMPSTSQQPGTVQPESMPVTNKEQPQPAQLGQPK